MTDNVGKEIFHKCEIVQPKTHDSFANLSIRLLIVSLLNSIGVIGLVIYFWNWPVDFQHDQLSLFLACYLIVLLMWQFFSLFTLQSEGVMRNHQSAFMFLCPNRMIVSSITLALAVLIFYWHFLFILEQTLLISLIFLSIFLPQLFVRVWDIFAKKESSLLAGVIAISLLLLVVAEEIRYGIGFRYLSAQVDEVAQVKNKKGQSQQWTIPIPDSPRWKRDGLTYYPELFSVLNKQGFFVAKDTHLALTPQAKKLMDMGIVPFNHYQGKAFSGLRILDRHDQVVYQYDHPNQFKTFKNIHPFILKALLVWENDKLRHLLFPEDNSYFDNQGLELNYLIEGPRIVKSLSEYIHYKITGEGAFSGGSTLMTTLEKITNTPGGKTQSVNDKLKQMIGAGLHLYGDDTGSQVKNALVDFLNSVPMAGGPKQYLGELYGFGTSYYAWFGLTINELNEQLSSPRAMERAQAYKNISTLIVSIRRPSELVYAPDKVNHQANILLQRMNEKGLINAALFSQSKALMPSWNPQKNQRLKVDYALHREAFSARNHYAHIMRQAVKKKAGNKVADTVNLQTIDVMPVAIELSTDVELEKNIRQVLNDMYTDVAKQSPFVQVNQKGLLNGLTQEELEQIDYGVTILEITPNRQWRVLANTDTQSNVVYNPADQGRFQWGSTAKLRVLVNYLMIMHDEALKIQEQLQQGNEQILSEYKKSSVKIKRLIANFLEQQPDAQMQHVMDWAMSRRISANPSEKFLTGETWHEFHNYQKSDDRKNPTLWQMTTESINLSFVRLMRDVVNYYIEQLGFDKRAILSYKNNPIRKKILEEAIIKEERSYQEGFDYFIAQVKKQVMLSEQLSDKAIITTARQIAQRIKTAEDTEDKTYNALGSLFKRLTYYEKPWLLARVREFNQAPSDFSIKEEQRIIRQTSNWFRVSKQWKKNTLYTYLERLAFKKGITPAWQKLGYPFEVSPSYAVVLGSSGDTPMSLLELAATLLNDGYKEQNISAIERLVLSPDTEFETPFKVRQSQQQIIPTEVALTARKAMEGVMRKGTAVFASRHPLMSYLPSVGAKTGTGDNRHHEKAVNRSAAVLSILDAGEGQSKYAICITMSVLEGDIERYKFTSKIPVRLLSRIADYMTPIVAGKSLDDLRIELAAKRKQQRSLENTKLALATTISKSKTKTKTKTLHYKPAITSGDFEYKAVDENQVAEQSPDASKKVFKSLF